MLLSDSWGRTIYDKFNAGAEGRMAAFQEIIHWGTVKRENPLDSDDLSRSIWVDSVKVADQYNEPGRFTSLMGFEWTSTPYGDNLHRIVLFEDGADKTSQTVPYSLFDSEDPAGSLGRIRPLTKGRSAAGSSRCPTMATSAMEDVSGRTFSGEPMDRAYAEARIRWEPCTR